MSDMVDVYFDEVITQTDLAWRILTDDDEQVWLPKSECELDEDDCLAQVPEWLAIEKGLV